MKPIPAATKITETIPCPSCGQELIERSGKYGKFYGCSSFPRCRQTMQISQIKPYLAGLNVKAPKKFKPTIEQQDIFDWTTKAANSLKKDPTLMSSLIIEACAGSGKTTTIEQAINLIKGAGETNIAYLVFNTKNREEAQNKGLPAKTTHQHGFEAIRNYLEVNGLPKVKINDQKVAQACKVELGPAYEEQKYLVGITAKTIGLLKNNLLDVTLANLENILEEYSVEVPQNFNMNEFFNFVNKIWNVTNENLGEIDFDDMLFLPIFYDMKLTQYKWLFCDEIQDFNAAQMEMAKRSVKNIFVGVGDRNQGIYAFRGADALAMDKLKEAFSAEEKSLSVSFRAPKQVADYVNIEFPHIAFSCLPSALEGSIETMTADQLAKVTADGDLVVCRMNAPLIPQVFALLRAGKKANIIGRDVSAQLVNMIERHNPKNNSDVAVLIKSLETYAYHETKKLRDMGRDMGAEVLSDKIETIIALSDGCKDVACILKRIDIIFSKNSGEGVSFATVHKAKGLEAKRVFILQPELLRIFEDISAQETNIRYVASTRALEEMYLVEKN